MSMPRWLFGFLIFAALAIFLEFLSAPPLLLFVLASLGIIPLAGLVGQSVERIAEHTGEALGGLLFATFGNATELIIGIFALREGLVDVVRASIIGAVLCNVLLVLGVATCIGNAKHGRLRFDRRSTSQYASLLALCITGLLLPAFAELFAAHFGQTNIVERGVLLSDVIAVLLLIGYLLSILFSVFHIGDRHAESDQFHPILGNASEMALARLQALRTQLVQTRHPAKARALKRLDTTLETLAALDLENAEQATLPSSASPGKEPTASPASAPSEQKAEAPQEAKAATLAAHAHKHRLLPAFLLLGAATIGVAWLSEILVGTIEPFTTLLGWNPAFVGLVFLPLVSTLPEYLNTSRMALDKRMGMVLAATAGSSIQIALLVAPVLVLVSLFMPHRLDLVFSIVELAVLGLGTFLYSEITQDGELVWLEGGLLILIYMMMGATVFFFGA